MPYRSTKEKAEAQKAARKLYVTDGLSLKEIKEQTGETPRTLRAWYNLGDWENLRANTELDRFQRLRDNLLGKAEAQIKEDKLPHTEIGLVYRLERMIVQREKKDEMVATIMTNTIQYQLLYLMEHDPELARAFVQHSEGFSQWIAEQDLTRPPEEARPLVQELARQRQRSPHQRERSLTPQQELARQRRGSPP